MKKRILSFSLVAIMTLTLFSFSAPATGAAPVGGDVATFDPVNGFMVNLKKLFDEPDDIYKPGSRWWLPEGLAVESVIKENVKIMHDMGLGFIEIVCMPETLVDNGYIPDNLDYSIWPAGTTSKQIYSWGSEEWQHSTRILIEEATKYGMGFSMTSGTHWANANLPEDHLRPDDDGAGKSLGYAIQAVSAGAAFNADLRRSTKSGTYVTRQDLERVVAIKVDPSNTGTVSTAGAITGTMTYAGIGIDITDKVTVGGIPVDPNAPLDAPGSMKDSTGQKAYHLEWTAPDDGNYHIFAYWLQATGQSPTPSATRNFTITYIDKAGMESFIDYYKTKFFADPSFVEAVKANGKGEMYMDSLEISATNGNTGCFWGYSFLKEFQDRRGYDLTLYLPYIIHSGGARAAAYNTRQAGSNGAFEAKIRADMSLTMTDMYRENVLKPLQRYLNDELNMKLRAEITYGVTYEISTPAQYVDFVETESLEFNAQMDGYKQLSGAAHVWGKRLSCEMGACNIPSGNQNYANAQRRWMQVMDTGMAAGIGCTVFHGFSNIEGADQSYSTSTNWWTPTYWPGHEGMTANWTDRWGPRQPTSVHYDDYMAMIHRNQAIVQQGIPQMDIGILHTDYNNNNRPPSRPTGSPSGTYDPDRANWGMYWQDMALQNNGYTYEYFAPQNLDYLLADGVELYGDNELLPDRVGYQALIIYQEAMYIESAYLILDLAKKGLPIVIVDGVIEDAAMNHTAMPVTDYKAGQYTLSLDGRDEEMRQIFEEMKALDNVEYLTSAGFNRSNPYDSATLRALLKLGVRPRAQLVEGSKNIVTNMRKADDALYLYAYNLVSDYDYNLVAMPEAKLGPTTVSLSVDVVGKPYYIDTWTTEVGEVANYWIEDGRTFIDVTLEPGETAFFAFDLNDAGSGIHVVETDADKLILDNGNLTLCAVETGTYTTKLSDGTVTESTVVAPANISLNQWRLEVESWTCGDKKIITEDRGLGYVTRNSYWTTNKTMLNAGVVNAPLPAWRDIPAIGTSVSGVGFYESSFTLPADWTVEKYGGYLKFDDLCGNLAVVYINGVKSTGLDFVAKLHDVSDLLKPGYNTISVECSSALLNAIRALGQLKGQNYPNLTSTTAEPLGGPGNWQSYGMRGNVELVTYGKAAVKPNVLAEISADNASGIVNTPASYTVALTNAKGVGSVELSFMFDGEILDKNSIALTPQSGFVIDLLNPAPVFQYVDQGIWKCTAKFMYMGFVGADGPLDVVKISGTAIKTGPATVTITGFAASGDNGDGVGPIPSQILTAAATVTVGGKQPVYSKYDLNKDGSIDETDLLYLIYFYQWNDRDPGWATDGLYNVFAKDCDFQVNGKVDLADMIELTANYGVYDPYA